MKRIFMLVLAMVMAFSFTACKKISKDTIADGIGKGEKQQETSALEEVELILWTYPVGNWGNPSAIANMLSGFRKKYPNIHITVEYQDYNSDDDIQMERAIAENRAPDLVFEGPERLVAKWGERGMMADLSDLWDSDAAREIYEPVRSACRYSNGEYYEFPVCMSEHCMAINYDLFKAAGALQYIDEESRTWSTKDFVAAVNALTAYGQERAGIVYCKSQGGDQGTRALINNLYGGTFTDPEHTKYTVDSEENIRALELLYGLKGIDFAPDMAGGDEVSMFCKGELAMAFCWNVSLEVSQTIINPYLGFEIFPMAFPSSEGKPRLQGGIWGFGVFDHGDKAKIEAAKSFIQYMTDEEEQYIRAVLTSGYWPVRDIGEIYVNDELMKEYSIFTEYMGDYYQVTPGWSEARKAWWEMLQKVGEGEDISAALKEFSDTANKAAGKEMLDYGE